MDGSKTGTARATPDERPWRGAHLPAPSDAAAVHARLASAGFRTYTRPTDITLGGSVMKIFCAEDPDGVVFEFMQFIRPA
jgi:hypothetical protein